MQGSRSTLSRGLSMLGHQASAIGRLGAMRALGRRSPFQVTLSLTNRCNFKCEYCEIPLQRRAEMTTAEWCDAIDQLADAGMGRASLIGGEPLLRPDVGDIVEHLHRRGVHVAMNTNGWLVEERLDEMSRLDLVCVTLDGPVDVHDGQRRRGSHERALSALRALKGRGVAVVTMTVITPSGAENVEHVLEHARDIGFTAFFQLEHDGNCDVSAPIAIRMGRSAVGDVARRLLRLKDEGWPVGNSRELLERHLDGSRYLGGCDECFAGRYYAYVLSDGTIAPCLLTQWQQPAGNGRRNGFAAAFHAMRPPDGPGCACVPTHEVNRILALDPTAVFRALDLALRGS